MQKEWKQYQKTINELLNRDITKIQKEILQKYLSDIETKTNDIKLLKINKELIQEKIEWKKVLIDINTPFLESFWAKLLELAWFVLFLIILWLILQAFE